MIQWKSVFKIKSILEEGSQLLNNECEELD